jgi:hypothetical protein
VEPLVVTFVAGVTPGKWQRTWNARMRREPLTLVPAEQDAALTSVLEGSAHMGLLRDVVATDDLHVIPLYREQPVVVAARDSLIAALDSVTLADLAGENVLEAQDAAALEPRCRPPWPDRIRGETSWRAPSRMPPTRESDSPGWRPHRIRASSPSSESCADEPRTQVAER